MNFEQEVNQLIGGLHAPEPERSGTLVRLVGLTLETRGIMAPLGACCEVLGRHGHRVEAEVVGFNDKTLFLMPFSEPTGVGPGDVVRVEVTQGRRMQFDLKLVQVADLWVGSSGYTELEALGRLLQEPGRISGAHLRLQPDRTDAFNAAVAERQRIIEVTCLLVHVAGAQTEVDAALLTLDVE